VSWSTRNSSDELGRFAKGRTLAKCRESRDSMSRSGWPHCAPFPGHPQAGNGKAQRTPRISMIGCWSGSSTHNPDRPNMKGLERACSPARSSGSLMFQCNRMRQPCRIPRRLRHTFSKGVVQCSLQVRSDPSDTPDGKKKTAFCKNGWCSQVPIRCNLSSKEVRSSGLEIPR